MPGIFLGLAQLNQSELKLKRLVNKHGLLGLDKVIAYALDEWTRDIKRNQLPSILGGVGPMHSFIQLCKSSYRDILFNHCFIYCFISDSHRSFPLLKIFP